jgi:ribosomal protein RSM22 (predicted rRNA methylase)
MRIGYNFDMGERDFGVRGYYRALLAFHEREKNINENFQGEWLVVKGDYEGGRKNNKGDLKGKNSRSKSKRRKDINCNKCEKKRVHKVRLSRSEKEQGRRE